MKYQKDVYNPHDEAEKFLETSKFIFEYESVFEYKNGFYQKKEDRELMERISSQLNNTRDQSRLSKVREVLESTKNILSTKEVQKNSNPLVINTKNGLLDLSTMTRLSHTPSPVFDYQVNANYNPDATCPTFMKFLGEILVDKNDYNKPDNELIMLLRQFIGYCLYIKLPFHKALIEFGDGSNGKNILNSLLEELFKGSVSHVHFEIIGKDRFATADLAGKLLNISSEFSQKGKLSDGEVKAIISGDTIRGQRKFGHSFDFRPFAKHIISTNNLPQTDDRSFGFFRRFIVIPFHIGFLFENEKRKIQEFEAIGKPYKKADPFLEEKLLKELDGIFLWAVKGLKELLENEHFAYSKQSDEMEECLRARSATVETFTVKHLDTSDVTAKVSLQEGYPAYTQYCQKMGFIPEGLKQFSDQLRKSGLIVKKGTAGMSYIHGAKLV